MKSSVEWKEPLTSSDVKGWPGDLSVEKQRLLEDWVSKNKYALKKIEEGTQKPYYWPDYQGGFIFASALQAPLAKPGKAKPLVYAICLRAKFAAMKNDFDRAFSDLLICYKFGLHLTGTKSIDEQLVGIAIRGIAINSASQILDKEKVSADSLKYFQQELSSCLGGQVKPIDFMFARFGVYDTAQKMFDVNNKDKVEALVKEYGVLNQLTTEEKVKCEKIDLSETTELTNKVFDYLDNVNYARTLWELHNMGEDLETTTQNIAKGHPWLSILTPAMCNVLRLSYRCKMETDALITTIAILRYKSDRGELPEDMNVLLKAGYLKNLPADPYHNGPLVYKCTGDSFILYSFGPDFVDDGGAVRYHWQEKEKGDIVFWPVEQIVQENSISPN